MGEVYLAQDTQLRRPVAVKLLPTEFTQNEGRLHRFEREAFAASSLNHPNILTIHEVGAQDNTHFIATEYVEGESLRQRMARGRMGLREALDVAIQIASALAAAHRAGIVHRDIKPENVMLRRDGFVKVLDFGLAKLVNEDAMARGGEVDTEAPTKAIVDTASGAVLGTPFYMSPEQARGLPVDTQTDIFSLGVVLYEMLAGRLPFVGATPLDVLTAILNAEPELLRHYAPEVSRELEHIVSKALRKDRDERYQIVKDMLIDLRDLKGDLELQAQLERSAPPKSRGHEVGTATDGNEASVVLTAQAQAAETGPAVSANKTSSVQYIVNQVKNYSRAVALTLAVLAFAAVAVLFWHFKYNRGPALTERDTVMLADFVNTTGDSVFDGTLKQGLAVQLGQSPFLNIYSDERVRETLRYMGRSAEERVTRDVAREICLRRGIKALLAGSISNLGTQYVLTLEAINAQTGDAIAREQTEAGSKEQVLGALGEATSKLRGKLGESLASIQKFDAPIEQVTTSSLEALKAFSLGNEKLTAGYIEESIPFYKRAVELDPNFAIAYIKLAVVHYNIRQPEQAARLSEKAFQLRDRVSERERFNIESHYYGNVDGDIDKAMEVYELWKRTYPRDNIPHNNLAVDYIEMGLYEKTIEEAREAIRLDPSYSASYNNLGVGFTGLNRFDESKAVYEQALLQKLDALAYHTGLYGIAFVQGEGAAMQMQIEWAKGKPNEHVMINQQAVLAEYAGQLRKARELASRAVDLAQRRSADEVAARFTAQNALRDAAFGDCRRAKEGVAKALSIARTRPSLHRSALALSLCGEATQAQPLLDELSKRFPKDTLVNIVWLPTIRAAIEVNRNNPAEAIRLLETASRYEMGAEAGLWPAYVRGLAYVRQRAGAEAVREFRKLLDHKGVLVVFPFYSNAKLYPLAQLGLARAAFLLEDPTQARQAYQDFFGLWKDADPDIAVLQEARQEYAKLQ